MRGRRELERSIIGAILYQPETFPKVQAALGADMFVDPECKKTVQAVHDCSANGYEINKLNVATVGKFTNAETGALADIEHSSADLGLLARKLAEQNILDRFIEFKSGITPDADPFDLIHELKALDNETAAIIGLNTRKPKVDLLNDFADYLLTNSTKGVHRIPTPFPTLTRMLQGGLSLGDISFIGGLPGSGKTSFMLSIALHAAKMGIKTAFVEGEMSINQILERLNGIATSHAVDTIREGKNFNDMSRDFISKLYDLPLDVVPCYERTVDALTAKIEVAIHSGCVFILLDYLQVFVTKGQAQDEFSKIKALSESLRKIALQNPVHLCVASSLNRNELGERRLTLGSFYGSSQLGHDCAVALVLGSNTQDDAHEMRTRERDVVLQVVKNRSGIRGDVALKFLLDSQRMVEIDTHQKRQLIGSDNGQDEDGY